MPVSTSKTAKLASLQASCPSTIDMWQPPCCNQADATFSNFGGPFSRRLRTMSQAVATTSTVMTSAISAMSSADAEEAARRPSTP